MIWWFGSGALFGLSFLHVAAWWLVFPALIVFLVALERTGAHQQIFWGSWLVGTLKAAGALAWFWYVYPMEWLGLAPGLAQLLLIGVYWLLVAAVIGLGIGVSTFLFAWIIRSKRVALFLFPVFWLVGEVLGAFIFSIYTWGPGSAPNSNFSFGQIGYNLIESTTFHSFAALGGVHLLTLVAAGIGVLIYWLFISNSTHQKKAVVSVSAVVILSVVVTIFKPDQAVVSQRVISVETYLTPDFYNQPDRFDKKAELIDEVVTAAIASSQAGDVIALPEDSRYTLAFGSTEATYDHLKGLVDHDLIFIDSSRIEDERGETVLRAFVYDLGDQSYHVLDKQYLVPHGEFVPYLHRWLLGLLGPVSLVNRLDQDLQYRPGAQVRISDSSENVPGVLFCMESVAPDGVAKLGAVPYVVHPISHGWFFEPTLMWDQLDRMLQTQALHNQTVIVEAANNKISALYQIDGTIGSGTVLESGEQWALRLFEF